MSVKSLTAADLIKLGGLKERCSAPLRCEKHGLAVPCELCDVEGSTGIVCSACGHYFAEDLARESDRACQSVAEFSRTRKIAFADVANETLLAQESERQRQEEIQRQVAALAQLKRERAEAERAEAERREQLERERVRREKADSERREQVERERIDRERAETEHREQLERERVQKEQAEAERQRKLEHKRFERKVGAWVWIVIAIAAVWYFVGSGSKERQTPLATPAPPSQVPSAAQTIWAASASTGGYISGKDDLPVASPHLPDNIASFLNSRGLRIPKVINKYCGVQPGEHPFFVQGDFDGDGRTDYAVEAWDDKNSGNNFVFFADGKIIQLDAWEYIGVNKARGTINTMDGQANLEFDSLAGVRCESSSVLYVYNRSTSRFDKFFTSD